MIGFFESGSFSKPLVIIKRQLSAGGSFFKLGLLVSHTVRGRKPFLPFGYPSFDIFGRVQGYVGPLDDDGLSRNGLGFVTVAEGDDDTYPLSDGSASQSVRLFLLWFGGYMRCLSIICTSTAFWEAENVHWSYVHLCVPWGRGRDWNVDGEKELEVEGAVWGARW